VPGDDVITRLAAKDEIRELLYRYCRAIDRCDAELLESVYHPDALDEHTIGDVGLPAADFRRRVIPHVQADWESTQHLLGNMSISLDGEVAHAETYFVAHHVRHPDPEGRQLLDVLGGRYVDHLERRDGEWRLSRRTVVQDWQETRTFNPGPFELHPSRRDRLDPGYVRSPSRASA